MESETIVMMSFVFNGVMLSALLMLLLLKLVVGRVNSATITVGKTVGLLALIVLIPLLLVGSVLIAGFQEIQSDLICEPCQGHEPNQVTTALGATNAKQEAVFISWTPPNQRTFAVASPILTF